MSDLNVDLLREGLSDYLEALRSHLQAIEQSADEAQSSFANLMTKQAGIAAEDYRSAWEPARSWLQDYVGGATRLAHLLEERLAELSKVR